MAALGLRRPLRLSRPGLRGAKESPSVGGGNLPSSLAISGANGTANVGDTASFTPTITGGTAPYTVAATGLPPGRAINNATTGLTTGAYATAGTYSATYTVTDNTGATASFTRSVVVSAAVTGPVLFLGDAGQSLAQSLGTATTANGGPNASQVLPAGYSTPNARVKIWTGSAFETYQPYVNSEQGTNAGTTWGPEWGAASAWLADNPTGTVYIVKHAVGSTGLAVGSSPNVWAPSAGQLYTAFINKIAAAKSALAAQSITITESALLWSQGQQDAKTTTDAGNYQTNGAAFFSQFRSDTGIQRILLVRLQIEQTNSGFPGWATVCAAQNALASADQNIDIVSTDGLETFDGLHRTVAAVNIEAAAIGAILTRWWAKAPFAGLTNVADPNNDRYARATTAGNLTTMKACLASDLLATATTATTQRTYIDAKGVRRNNLAANTLRFDWSGGKRRLVHEAQAQNALLYSRDLTNPVWVAINITPLKDQTGLDGVANSASRITATANGGTILQSVTVTAAGARTKSLDIKRLVGTGTIEATLDGSTYVVISGFDANGIARVPLPSQTLAAGTVNVGFRIATSGDSFLIDATQFETGTFATSPIYTTGSATTRPSEKVTPAVQTDSQGTAGTFVYRGRNAVSIASQFVGGDGGNAIMGRSSNAVRLTQSNGTASLNADTTGAPYAGSFGVANTFDASSRRLSINGSAVAFDANAETARTGGITIGAGSSTNALSQTGGTCDLFAWGPTLVSDATLQALAAANP